MMDSQTQRSRNIHGVSDWITASFVLFFSSMCNDGGHVGEKWRSICSVFMWMYTHGCCTSNIQSASYQMQNQNNAE